MFKISYVLFCYRIGTVYINIKLIFENLINVPTEAAVLQAANEKLATKFRVAREITTQKLGEPVTIQKVTFYSEYLSWLDFSDLWLKPCLVNGLGGHLFKFFNQINNKFNMGNETICFLTPPIPLLETGSNSFRIETAFMISNVTMSTQCEPNLTNETYNSIQNSINSLVS